MQITHTQNTILKSQNFAETACTIDAEDARHIAHLLRDNYSDTRWASVREVTANAVDACKEANNGSIPLVKVPTQFDTEFAVRDYGHGLTREQVIGNPDLNPVELAQANLEDPLFGLYSKYGKSTKRNSNVGIGGFGIGRFAPLSYGDSFTIESFRDGTRSIYVMRKDEYNDTRITELSSEATTEPNGLRVSMAVKQTDVNRFACMVKRLSFFGVKFDVTGMVLPDWKKVAPIILEDKGWKIVETNQVLVDVGYAVSGSYRRFGTHFVSMGGVSYPLDTDNLQASKARTFLFGLSGSHSMILELPIGSVKLHHSREALEYNDQTKAVLEKALQNAHESLRSLMQKGIDSSKSFTQAVERLSDYYKAVGNDAVSTVDIVWKGRTLSRYWNIRCEWDNNTKTYPYEVETWAYSSAPHNSNGVSYHCGASQGAYSTNMAIMYDDLPSNQKGKNVIRKVKYLLDVAKMEKVFLVRLKGGSRLKLEAVMKKCHFDELEKSGNFFKVSTAKEVAPFKKTSGGKKTLCISGISLFQQNNRYRLHRAWKKNLLPSDIPAGKKYFVVTDRGYVSGKDEFPIHPCRFEGETTKEFLGLPESTPIFGITKVALARIKKGKFASEWVSLLDETDVKVASFLKAHPEVNNGSTVTLGGNMSWDKGFLTLFSQHPKLHPELAKRFQEVRSKFSQIVTQQKSISEKRSLLELVCKSFHLDPDLKAVVKTSHCSESSEFFGLCRTYLPFTAFYEGYYNDDQNSKTIRCLEGCTQPKKLETAVLIANAIYFQENVSQTVKSA